MSERVLAGDLVLHGEGQTELVVVDVAGVDAVLRDKADKDVKIPIIAPVADLTVVGHLGPDDVPGWTETASGKWVKDDDEH